MFGVGPNGARAAGILTLALVGPPAATSSPVSAPGDPPNIIVILADDLGYYDPSVYAPNTVSLTPNIDRLAHDGVLFLDAHAPSSMCTASRYGLLAGRYSWRTRLHVGVLSFYDEPLIDQTRTTLPEMLQECGYRTAAIGKWHLGLNVPANDGIGFVRPGAPSNADFGADIQGGPLDHGFDTYFGAQPRRVGALIRDRRFEGIVEPSGVATSSAPPEWCKARRSAIQLDEALRFIDECHAGDSDRPFFLYFASQLPHAPYEPADSLAGHPIAGTSGGGPRGDSVKEFDVTVGAITQHIDRLGLASRTLILVTSDNGAVVPGRVLERREHQPGDFRGTKGSVLEGGHRIPLVARWGDGTASGSTIPRGTVSREIVGLQDILSTIADLLDVPLDPAMGEDSESFLDELVGRSHDQPTRHDLIMHGGDGRFAIRRGHWKLALNSDKTAEASATAPLEVGGQLFNIHSDPAELTDRAADHPWLVSDLARALNRHRAAGHSHTRAHQERDRGGRASR